MTTLTAMPGGTFGTGGTGPRARMRFGLTGSDEALVSRKIQRLTGARYSHALVIFEMEDSAPLYFESWMERDERTGKTGVRGPYPLRKIQDWAAERPGSRRFLELPWLQVTAEEAYDAYIVAAAAVRTVRYAPVQIVQNWLYARTGGLVVGWRHGSARRWTCSEFCVRVTPARLWPAYGIPNITADWVAPAGRRMPSVEAAWLPIAAPEPG